MKILVIGGGDSSEREVSLRSAAAVGSGLQAAGHQVTSIDARAGDAAILDAARVADVVFPILHGTGGEDGTIQTLLDMSGKPYLGSGANASQLCFDKQRLKTLAQQHQIATPHGEVVDAVSFWKSGLITTPFVLKPVADGSSVGTMIVRGLPFDEARARELLAHYHQMLLEELIDGIEITVPVLGSTALPVIEIVPPTGAEFNYDNKYNGATAELCPPPHVDAPTQKRAQALAEHIHQLAGCRHLSRTDMILKPSGELILLEINTLPGLTNTSLFPKSAAVAGLSWPQLMDQFVQLALT